MKLNIIGVYNEEQNKILMCKRAKDPYKGLYNFVGGKVEDGEDGLESAYRELYEETGIVREDIVLTHLMDLVYKMSDIELNVYAGRLNKDVELLEEVNPLHWVDADDNFFDMKRFAGEGNLGHIAEYVKLFKSRIFK